MDNWLQYKLVDVSQFIDYRGKTPTKIESGVQLITAKNVKKGYLSIEPKEYISEEEYQTRLNRGIPQNGDVLFTTEAPLGNVAILNLDYKVSVGQRLITLRPDVGKLLSPFLYYLILSPVFQNKLIELSTGTTVKGIKASVLKKIVIDIPPLPEQKRIVSKLDALFERIDKSMDLLEENIKHTESLMASALDEVFTSVHTEKYSPILDVCSIANKNIIPNGNEVYNYVGLENIESETGRLVEFSKTNGSEIKSSKAAFRKGAVLYGKLRPYLNKVYIADFDGVCTTEILPFYPNCDILTKEYLAFYLRSKKFVNEVNNNTSGARMPRATTTFFKKIAKVPVPTIEVQKKDVEKLKKLSTKNFLLQEEQQDKLTNLKSLKESILDKAFKGEL